jgi:hypothetical protein
MKAYKKPDMLIYQFNIGDKPMNDTITQSSVNYNLSKIKIGSSKIHELK